jgi:hypothetical protein
MAEVRVEPYNLIAYHMGNLASDAKDNDRLADDPRINASDIRIDLTVDLLLAYRPTC